MSTVFRAFVRSGEELLIDNFYFLNGVARANRTHKQSEQDHSIQFSNCSGGIGIINSKLAEKGIRSKPSILFSAQTTHLCAAQQ